MFSSEKIPEAAGRPLVVPCMMMPNIEHELVEGKELVWLYAYNVGDHKAMNVRISTNIPQELMDANAWSNGMLASEIEELDPDVPFCIGVMKVERTAGQESLWVHFDYSGSDRMDYSQRCEIDLR